MSSPEYTTRCHHSLEHPPSLTHVCSSLLVIYSQFHVQSVQTSRVIIFAAEHHQQIFVCPLVQRRAAAPSVFRLEQCGDCILMRLPVAQQLKTERRLKRAEKVKEKCFISFDTHRYERVTRSWNSQFDES